MEWCVAYEALRHETGWPARCSKAMVDYVDQYLDGNGAILMRSAFGSSATSLVSVQVPNQCMNKGKIQGRTPLNFFSPPLDFCQHLPAVGNFCLPLPLDFSSPPLDFHTN